MAACSPPFGLGTASTRALENGAIASLTSSKSFEMTGSYTQDGVSWTVDLQKAGPAAQHISVSTSNMKLDAIILSDAAYFRGQQFLSEHMGADPLSRNLVKVAGNSWWKGSSREAPQLADFTDGRAFGSSFLGPVATRRTDNVSVDGVDAVELSSTRGDVFIASAQPYRLLRVRLGPLAVIDSIRGADLRYSNFDQDFQISAPSDVIDFTNLSTLPPVYTVISVDTSRCASPCSLSATVKNLGGLKGAQAPSTVTFSVTDSATGQVVGSCKSQVVPDVGFNATTTVSCTIASLSGQVNAAKATATADNPGRA
jgi:hypothetical protein